jgi:uncharacterized coiled-coil DUF342 family protein
MEPIQVDLRLKELIIDLRGKAVGYEYNDEEMLAWGNEALAALDRLVAERDLAIEERTAWRINAEKTRGLLRDTLVERDAKDNRIRDLMGDHLKIAAERDRLIQEVRTWKTKAREWRDKALAIEAEPRVIRKMPIIPLELKTTEEG